MDGGGPGGAKQGRPAPRLAVEVEVYIEPDGSVTFADLAAGMLPVARALDMGDAAQAAVRAGQPADSQDSESER